MSKSDQWISIFIAFLILIHLSVLIISIVYHKISWMPVLNLLAALAVILYWVQKQISFSHQILYSSELAVLGFEVAVIAFAVYSILNKQNVNWLMIIQKTVFGIHLSVLVLFLVFMLTFKINRLI